MKQSLQIAAMFLLMVLLTSCFDEPGDFVTPVVDVELNVPIANRSYTLEEAIEDEDDVLYYSDPSDPNTLGMLYYSTIDTIETIMLDDGFELSGFQTSISEKIGSVNINDVAPVRKGLRVNEWTSLPIDTIMIFPENESGITVGFPAISEFEYVKIKSGTLVLRIVNKLPVKTEMKDFQIKNNSNNSIIAENEPGKRYMIDPKDSLETTIPLRNVVIENDFGLSGTLYTPGSDLQIVKIPDGVSVEYVGILKDLVIDEAYAPLPPQDPFSTEEYVVMDDSSYINFADLSKGSLDISFDSHLDVALNLSFEIENLLENGTTPFRRIIKLERNERAKKLNIASLAGWKLNSATPGALDNKAKYNFTVTTENTDEARKINVNDYVSVDINLSDLEIAKVKGKLKPTTVDFDERGFDMDLGEINDKLNFSGLKMADPIATLELFSSPNLDLVLNTDLTASNSSQTNSIPVKNVVIKGNQKNSIDLREFGLKNLINGFTGNLPSNFSIAGDVVVNPEYAEGEVSTADSIYGRVLLEFPLQVGISGGEITDTIDLEWGDFDKDELDNVNFGELYLTINNKVAAALEVTAEVVDSFGTHLTYIPAEYNADKTIHVLAPEIDDNGNVVTGARTEQVIRMEGTDVQLLTKGAKIIAKIKFGTSNEANLTPAKFRITDSIEFYVGAKMSYKTDFEDEEN